MALMWMDSGRWFVPLSHQNFSDPSSQAVDDSSFTSEPFLPGAPIDLLESGEFTTEVGTGDDPILILH